MPQDTSHVVDQMADPYSGTATTAQEFLDAVFAFQRSTSPVDIELRETASQVLGEVDDDE